MIRLLGYLFHYRIRDMAELIRNEGRDPLDCEADLKGKTVVLSGSTSGIGLETARLFASRGARLVCLNRDPAKSAEQERELARDYGCQVQTILVDFSSLGQVRECARQLLALETPIDVLIHNAGVFYTKRTFTSDGIEMVFQVNHLGSFLLTQLLLPRLVKENRARILYVNSEGHRFALAGVHTRDLRWHWHRYTGLKSYGAAKTAQLLTMLAFQDQFAGTGVTINAMHPGNVTTNIGNNNGKLYRDMKKKLVLSSAKDPRISAQALLYLAADPSLATVSGQFFNLTTQERPAPHARDRGAVAAVWNKSMELCGLP